MSILAWIEEQRQLKLALSNEARPRQLSEGGRGLWVRCDCCGLILYIKLLKENQRICWGCGNHFVMACAERIHSLIDSGTWNATHEFLSPCDPLLFEDERIYQERLEDMQDKTALLDAVLTGTGMLEGVPIALGVMDFRFMGGSMGSVVGEKITRLIEAATQSGISIVLVCASGGARMQEGIFSLMQMAKISAALYVHQVYAKLMYIALLTAPTTGGVTASFAMLGDIVMAEPKALIGFAGRRVIQQTLMEELPDDFQTSEYLLYHGLLDLVVSRESLNEALSQLFIMHRDGPLRQRGSIPYGYQAGLTSMEEDLLREEWGQQPWEAVADQLLDGLDQELRASLLEQAPAPAHMAYPPDQAFEEALQGAKEAEAFWMADHVEHHHCSWFDLRPYVTAIKQDRGLETRVRRQFCAEEDLAILEQAVDDTLMLDDVYLDDPAKRAELREVLIRFANESYKTNYTRQHVKYIPRRRRDTLALKVENMLYHRGLRGGEWMYTYRTYEEEVQATLFHLREMEQLLARNHVNDPGFNYWETDGRDIGPSEPTPPQDTPQD